MGFDEDGNYTLSAESDSEKYARGLRSARQEPAAPAPGKRNLFKEALFGKWAVLLRVVLIGGLVVVILGVALGVAPGLISENKSEMPPLYNRLMRLLEFLLP